MTSVFSFSFIGFSDAPTPFIVHLRLPLSDENYDIFHHKKPPRMLRQCMCGGDDHLAWKCPVYSGGVQRVAYRGRVRSLLLRIF